MCVSHKHDEFATSSQTNMQNAESRRCAFSSIFLCSFYLFSLCIGFSVFRWQFENRANMNHFTQSLPFNLDIVYGFDCSSSQIHALKVCMHRLHPIRMNLFIHTGGGGGGPPGGGGGGKGDSPPC